VNCTSVEVKNSLEEKLEDQMEMDTVCKRKKLRGKNKSYRC